MHRRKITGFSIAVLCVTALIVTAQRHERLCAAEEMHHRHDGRDQHMHAMTSHEITVRLETKPDKLEAGKEATIIFHLKDEEGKPLQGLTISHDRLLHVMLIGEDFTVFSHIHPEDFGTITPEMKREARFPVRFTFPKAGRYLIALDTAVEGTMVTKQLYVQVMGKPEMGISEKNLSRQKVFGEYTVTLQSNPERIRAGETTELRYTIKKNSEPVTDLKPYLAAPMHIAIVLADLNNFIHAHGEIPGALSHDPAGHIHGAVHDTFGPEIETDVVFPVRGLYKIFSEVNHRGKVILLDFMVDVE